MAGVTFDAGGLIALDHGDRRVVALLARAAQTGTRATVPATAFAQAVRRPERQVRLPRFIRQATTDVVAPTGSTPRTSAGCSPPAARPTSRTPTW